MGLRRCPKCWSHMVHEDSSNRCPVCGWTEIARPEPVQMTFADRLKLEQEYHLWLADESVKIGASIDGTRLTTMLTFLKYKGLLKEDWNGSGK